MWEAKLIEQGDLGRLFPMADVDSARLMKLKAQCLWSAGVLPAPLREQISRRADEVVAGPGHRHELRESEVA